MRFSLVRRVQALSGDLFRIKPSIRAGLESGKEAVVALESTVICHGLPYPQNFDAARSLEKIISDRGAKPATIGIMHGKIAIGLSGDEIRELSQANGKDCFKVSRRDLAYVVAQGHTAGGKYASLVKYGGTTVSATMLLAHQAGISIFATGGIGGVHRNGQNSWDVSADLTELGRTPVAVVCAGVKSILDIPRTLEFLETQGVCVATVGDTLDFPAFFSRQSGHFSSCHVENARAAADLIYTQKKLNLQSGILLAVPIPKEDEIPNEQVETWIEIALREASSQGIVGRDITPFLLKRLSELSSGKTLKANVALLRNNAKVAAQIAVALKELEQEADLHITVSHAAAKHTADAEVPVTTKTRSRSFVDKEGKKIGRPVVIGGTVLDIMAQCKTDIEMNGATYQGDIFMSCGGVGRNIADCLARMDADPFLISAVGQDTTGQIVKNACRHMDFSGVRQLTDFATSSYVGLLSTKGQLHAGVMNMEIHGQITPDYVAQFKTEIQNAPMVVLDGNLKVDTMDYILDIAGQHRIPVWYEPTDAHKADKPFQTDKWQSLSYLSPNLKELMAICKYMGIETHSGSEGVPDVDEQLMPPAYGGLFERMPNLQLMLIKLGKRGCLVVTRLSDPLRNHKTSISDNELFSVHGYHAPPVRDDQVLSVSGSGDCMVGGMIYGLIRHGSFHKGAELGTIAAGCSLKARETVPATITTETSSEFDIAG